MEKIGAAQKEATEAKTALAEMEKRIVINDSDKDSRRSSIGKLDKASIFSMKDLTRSTPNVKIRALRAP